MKKPMYTRLLLCLMCLLPYSFAFAGYSISPVRIYLKPDEKVASISMTNETDTEATFQLAVYKWTRVRGQDVYEESQDILVTPVVFSFAPAKTQLIRIAQRHNAKITEERAYRLFIKELPSRQSDEKNAVNVVLQFGIPVFLIPSKSNTGSLACKVMQKENKFNLSCSNTYNQHVLISGIDAKENPDLPPRKISMNQYLFQDEHSVFPINVPAGVPMHNLSLITLYQGRKIHTPLKVE